MDHTEGVDFTIKEMLITTWGDEINQNFQGVHQVELTASRKEDSKVHLAINVFHKPKSECIYIETEQYENISYRFFDRMGRLISHALLTGSSTCVDVSELKNGTYLLTLTNDKIKLLKKYSVLKH